MSSRVRPAFVLMLSLIAAAPEAGAQSSRSYPNTQQALAVNGGWSGWIKQASTAQTQSPGGGIATQLTVESSTLEGPLANLVSNTLVGPAKPVDVQLVAYDIGTSSPVNTMTVTGARLQEIDFPAADASSTAPLSFTVKFAPALTQPAAAAPKEPPVSSRVKAPLAAYFKLAIDSLPGSYVTSVGPIAVTATEKGAQFPGLVVTYRFAATAQGQQQLAQLQQWFASAQPRNGTLTFMSADMKTAVLVEQFSGLRVTGISTSAGTSVVSMAMSGMRIQGAKY
jgi:hypothetical protein